MTSYAYDLVSIVGLSSNFGAVRPGLASAAEAATSVTTVLPMVVAIVNPSAICLLFSLCSDLLFGPLSHVTCAGGGESTCGRCRVPRLFPCFPLRIAQTVGGRTSQQRWTQSTLGEPI